MVASTPSTPQVFNPGFTTPNGTTLNNALAGPLASTQYGIIAKASGNQTTAVQLLTTYSAIATVATAADAVKLLPALPGKSYQVYNGGANACQIFGTSPDTINNVATGTGISLPAGSLTTFDCIQAGKWVADQGTALSVSTINGLTITTSTGTLTVPNGVTFSAPTFSGTAEVGVTAIGSAALTAVSTTTLAPIPGLSATLVTSGTYSILAELPVTANAAGGTQIAAVASNSLTATSFNVTGKFTTISAAAAVNTTTLSGAVGTTTATVLAELVGTIVVNTGGLLIIEGAQNVATSATTTFAAGGFLQVTRIA